MTRDWKYIGVIARNTESRKRLQERIGLLLMNYGFVTEGQTEIIPWPGEFNLLQQRYTGYKDKEVTVRYVPLHVPLVEGFVPRVRLEDIIFTRGIKIGLCDATMRFLRTQPREEHQFYADLVIKPYNKLRAVERVLPREPGT